ncbi:MAG: ABC transporter permease subunit [Planctomycetes bacterium]|nr:ABC transporter permease subunit [Planctomycetota bacterium]
MRTYALRRLAIGLPLVLFMSFVVFLVMGWSGNSAFDALAADPSISPQILNLEKRNQGLHRPLVLRYLYWLRGVCFDLRLAPQRRVVADFDMEAKDLPQRHAVAAQAVFEPFEIPAEGAIQVGAEPVALPGLADPAALSRLFNAKRSDAAFLLLEGPAGATVRVHLASRRPEEEGAREAAFEFPCAVPEGSAPDAPGIARAEIFFQAVAGKGVSVGHLTSLRVSSMIEGPLRLREARARVRSYALEEKEGRRMRDAHLRLRFTGTPGERVSLGRLDSPYVGRVLDASEWQVDWEAFDRDRAPPPPALEGLNEDARARERDRARQRAGDRLDFDALEFDAHLDGNEARTLRITFRSLPEGREPWRRDPASAETVETPWEVALSPGDQRCAIPLAALAGRGANLRAVRGLAFGCDRACVLTLDDLRLRQSGSGFRIGRPEFGQSVNKKMGVWTYLLGKMKNTIGLNVMAILLIWSLSIPAGVYAAARAYRPGDKILTLLMYLGQAVPSFFLATLVLFGISLLRDAIPPDGTLGFLRLPLGGRTGLDHDALGFWGRLLDVAHHGVGPVLVMTLGGMAGLQRVMRATMMEEKTKLYVTAARARGVPERSLFFKHALRNAILPFIAGLGSLLPAMIGGSAFIEIIFNYPGMGRAMLEAVQNYDTNVVMASMFLSGILIVAGNLLADLLLAAVDPRISLEGRGA